MPRSCPVYTVLNAEESRLSEIISLEKHTTFHVVESMDNSTWVICSKNPHSEKICSLRQELLNILTGDSLFSESNFGEECRMKALISSNVISDLRLFNASKNSEYVSLKYNYKACIILKELHLIFRNSQCRV